MESILAGLASNAMSEMHAGNQYNREIKLMRKQNAMNQENVLGAYQNQVNGMKMAGLSPAGAMNQAPSVPSVSKGSVGMAENVEFNPENMLLQAQAENLRAQTEKTEAETDKLTGVDTDNTIADTILKGATTEEKKELTQQIKNINEQYADENTALKGFGKAMAQKWTESDWFKALKPDTKETIQAIADGKTPLTVGSMTALFKAIKSQGDLSDADHKMAKNAFANAVLETIFTNDDLWNAEVEQTKWGVELKKAQKNNLNKQNEKMDAEINKLKYRYKEIIDEEIDKMHSETNVNNAEYWMKLKQKLAMEYENMDLSRAEGRYGNYAWRTLENFTDRLLSILQTIIGVAGAGKFLKGSIAAGSLPNQHGYNVPGGKPKSHPLETRGFKPGDKPSDGKIYDPETKEYYRIDTNHGKTPLQKAYEKKADEYDKGVQQFWKTH